MEEKKGFELKLVTPLGLTLHKAVIFARLPLEDGEIGVLPNHGDMLLHLKKGVIAYYDLDEKEFFIEINDGIAEILANSVTIFAPRATHPLEECK